MATMAATIGNPDVAAPETAQALTRRMSWVLTFALMFFATRGVFSFQHVISVSGAYLNAKILEPREHGFLGYVVLPGFAYATILYLVLSRFKDVMRCAAHFKLQTLIAILAVSSILWSQEPSRSALFSLFYLAGVLFAYYIVSTLETEELMDLLMGTGVALCVIGLAAVILFPAIGISAGDDEARAGAWIGIFIDRVSAAKCLVFLVTPGIMRLTQRCTAPRLAYVALMMLMIVRAKVVTAIIAVAAYTVCVLFLRACRKAGPRMAAGFVAASVVLTAIGAAVGAQVLPGVLGAFGRNATLSGRTEVWAAVMRSIDKHPLLGYGYYAFWLGLKGESGNVIHSINWSFGYAHNELLEIWLQLGIVGVICVAATFLLAVKNAWYCFRHDQTGRFDWYISLLVVTLVYNIDEETILFPNDLLSILYVVMCCSLAIAVLQIRRDSTGRSQGRYADDLSLAG
jgi:exopolysaccharide production protein ExoQ